MPIHKYIKVFLIYSVVRRLATISAILYGLLSCDNLIHVLDIHNNFNTNMICYGIKPNHKYLPV